MSDATDAGARATSESRRHTQTHAEAALEKLLPLAAKFQRLFKDAIQARESGFVIMRVEYQSGRVLSMQVENRDVRKPGED